MEQLTTPRSKSSRAIWDYLEELVRMKVREFIQALLEDEVTELLGRKKSVRRGPLDSRPGYRNGYGRERKLTLGCGTITLHRPRVRGLEERFKSRILPLFARRTRGVNQLIPHLYLHGLAQGDFDLALRGLLGEEAPISASTVARLKESWQTERGEWRKRSLAGVELVFMWVDGVYVKAGLEKAKAALLVIIGGLSDGREGNPGRGARLPGVYRKLVGGIAGPERARAELSPSSGGRWSPGHLGRLEQHLSQRSGATVLEP